MLRSGPEEMVYPHQMRLILTLLLCAAIHAQTAPEYVFGFLRAHPERAEIPAEKAQEIQKLHMAHLGRMAGMGHLIAAGPLGDPDLRGVVLFQGITLEQARELASQDPAVQKKRLIVDVAPWPGPPGIGTVTMAKMKADPNAEFKMTRNALVVYWKTSQWPADLNAKANRGILTSHMAFMDKLKASGAVHAIAPLVGSKEFVGVAIYKTEKAGEALQLCSEDPFITSGWVKPQALVWFHSADTFDKL
jgi:uncharacterized protein YciI